MRFCFVVFAVLAGSVIVAADPPTVEKCAAWNVLGYRLGMTRTEAHAVRGGEFVKKTNPRIPSAGEISMRRWVELRPDVKGTLQVSVRFDEIGGGAFAVRSRLQAGDPGSTKVELIRKLGPPDADSLQIRSVMSPSGNFAVTETRWESAECDADVFLDVGFYTEVFLLRHGGQYDPP